MSASRKIAEAENILLKLNEPNVDFRSELEKFVKTIHDVFLHLLEEYNVKFGLGIKHVGLEKFKSTAKKAGNIGAINFLIWYEKEYKKLRNNPEFGKFLEKEYELQEDQTNIIMSCYTLLDETKKMVYYSYENF